MKGPCDLPHLQQVIGEIFSIVYSPVHADETLYCGLVFYIGVVQACVEHDDCKRKDVTGVCNNHAHTHAHTHTHNNSEFLTNDHVQD